LSVNALNDGADKINKKGVLEGLAAPPEFSATQRTDEKASACVFDQPDNPCDPVFGLNLLVPLGTDILSSLQTTTWSDKSVSWKPKSHFDDSDPADPVSCKTHCFFVSSNDDFHAWIKSHLTAVDNKESKHDNVDTDCAAEQQVCSRPVLQ
jgi:hypothetical protein